MEEEKRSETPDTSMHDMHLYISLDVKHVLADMTGYFLTGVDAPTSYKPPLDTTVPA